MKWWRALAVVTTIACATLVTSSAHADDPRRPGWAFGSPSGEAALGSLALASNLAWLLPQRDAHWGPDRARPWSPAPGLASDVLGAGAGAALQIGTGYLLESSYLAATGAPRPGIAALHEAVVEAEAATFDAGITSLMKRLSGRCRPRARHGDRCDEPDAFPSGHTSAIASIAGARVVGLLRGPFDGPALATRVTGLGLAEAATLATGILRVTSGAHSVEDVLVGAAVGHATGLLVALAHPTVREVPRGAGGARGAAIIVLSYGGRF